MKRRVQKTIAVSVIIGTFIVQCLMCSIITQPQYAVLPSRFELEKNEESEPANDKKKRKN